jgi:hypothetical protein
VLKSTKTEAGAMQWINEEKKRKAKLSRDSDGGEVQGH